MSLPPLPAGLKLASPERDEAPPPPRRRDTPRGTVRLRTGERVRLDAPIGKPTGDVHDGDTFRLNDGRNARLFGVDAFELNQTGRARNGRAVPLGRQAREALAPFAQPDAEVTPTGALTYGRPVASLENGGDAGRDILDRGLALATPEYLRDDPSRLSDYMEAERLARVNRRGAFADTFQSPSTFRHGAPDPWEKADLRDTPSPGSTAVFWDDPTPQQGLRPEIERGYVAIFQDPASKPADLLAYAKANGFNIAPGTVKQAYAARNKGAKAGSRVSYQKPPRVLTDQHDGVTGAALRGVADPINMLDEVAAVGDTLGVTDGRENLWNSDRRFGDILANNLDQNRSILDFDDAYHPYARFGGQLAGGLIVPGASVERVGATAATKAIEGGAGRFVADQLARRAVTSRLATVGAVEGAAAGVGQGETWQERAQGGLIGAPAGAVLGVGAGLLAPKAIAAGRRIIDFSSAKLPAGARRAIRQRRGLDPAEGRFGTIHYNLASPKRWGKALERMREDDAGEIPAAIHHPEIGNVDLVWGTDKFGVKHIAEQHPEVMDDLPRLVERLPVKQRPEEVGNNRFVLEDDTHRAIVAPDYDGETKRWVVTAYEKKGKAPEGADISPRSPVPDGGSTGAEAGADVGALAAVGNPTEAPPLPPGLTLVDDVTASNAEPVPSQPQADPTANNLWRASRDDLERMLADKARSDDDKLVEAFGDEGAAEFRRLDRKRNSSSPWVSDEGSNEFEARFGDDKLTPDQMRLAFGVGETDAQADDIQTLLRAHDDLAAGGADEAGQDWLGYVAALGARRAPAEELAAVTRGEGTPQAQAAFVRLQGAYQALGGQGVGAADIPQRMVAGMVSRGIEPETAAELVDGFVDGMRRAGGSAPPTRRQAAVERLVHMVDTGAAEMRAARNADADLRSPDRIDIGDRPAPLLADASPAVRQAQAERIAPVDVMPERPSQPASSPDLDGETAAVEAADEWGEQAPDLAGNLRLDKLDSPQAIKRALVATHDRVGGFDAATRGRITHAETERLASEMGMTADDLLKRRKGQAFNAEEALAARQILARSATDLVNMARRMQRVDNPGEELEAAFKGAWLRHVAIQEQVAGATAEAGRALQAFRMVADARAVDRVLPSLGDIAGGATRLKDVADKLVDLELTGVGPGGVNSFAAKALKPRFRDKLIELYYNSLLSGPQTHAVNILSNTLTSLGQLPEHAVAATVGAARKALPGQAATDRVLFSELGARGVGLIQGTREGLRQAARTFVTGDAADAVTKVEQQTQRAISGVKGSVIRTPTRALAAEDEMFKAMARRMELSGLAVRTAAKEGLKGKAARDRAADLLANPTDDMLARSFVYGRYLTFQSPLGDAGRHISAITEAMPVLKLVLPFIRTPTNILKFAIERSPAAPVLKEWRKDIVAGGARRDLAVAKVMVGTGIGATIFQMANEGKITGGGPADDSARRLLIADGWQPYSFKAGGRYYSYARLDPYSTTLGTAADLVDLQSHMTEKQRDNSALLVGTAILHNLANKTWLSGLSTALEALNDPDRSLEGFVSRTAGAIAVPAVVAQSARLADPVLREARAPLDRIRSRLPGASKSLPPRRDVFGKAMVSEGGLGPDIIAPIYTTTGKADPTVAALLAAETRIGMPSRKVGKRELTPAEYSEYQRMAGGIAKPRLDTLVRDASWKVLGDEDQQDAVDKLMKKARAEARSRLFGGGTTSHENEQADSAPPLPSGLQLHGAPRQRSRVRKSSSMPPLPAGLRLQAH